MGPGKGLGGGGVGGVRGAGLGLFVGAGQGGQGPFREPYLFIFFLDLLSVIKLTE